MAGVDYEKLYALQDQVLASVFSVEKEFYLTGGTCLHRFYLNDRYSDDLDFFANQSPRFSFAIKNLKSVLSEEFTLRALVETKNFSRFLLGEQLQVDFVNDVGYRQGEPFLNDKGYVLDTLENILSNKLSALIGRDEPKDVFDIYRIWKKEVVSWTEALSAAHEKAAFSDDELVIRLKTFPPDIFARLQGVEKESIASFSTDLPSLIAAIIG